MHEKSNCAWWCWCRKRMEVQLTALTSTNSLHLTTLCSRTTNFRWNLARFFKKKWRCPHLNLRRKMRLFYPTRNRNRNSEGARQERFPFEGPKRRTWLGQICLWDIILLCLMPCLQISRPPQGIHYAGISTPEGATDQYLGARLSLTVHNLTMMIQSKSVQLQLELALELMPPLPALNLGGLSTNSYMGT